ncbi:MAG: hypothetical protein CFE24_02945 [Flavobacterium sp. BFFFF2]|nr:MAG: hypothetical protein CFE24_02945 [Flavobacterium sp. BFFFF2]
MLKSLFLVGFGGALGSMLRFLVQTYMPKWLLGMLPLGTFTVNVLGSFLAGYFSMWVVKQFHQSDPFSWLLITGFCGGFTTFSALSIEVVRLFEAGQLGWAFAYLMATLILGFSAAFLGMYLAR